MGKSVFREYSTHPLTKLKELIFGHPLRTRASCYERLNAFWGIPVLAVDALSSVAYATEEILLSLSIAGSAALIFSPYISLAIVGLIAIVITSYKQTVDAYPEGGGAYGVAKDQLGTTAALIAAAVLLIDYVLTVAVSVTAGVRALVSAFPELGGNKIMIAGGVIVILTWINLRGIRESSRVLALPVYSFIILMLVMGGMGLFYVPETPLLLSENPPVDLATQGITVAIILRAFAGGCTAMTGIEAIANAGSSLAKPQAFHAKLILGILGILLGMLCLSISVTAYRFNIVPLISESVVSQIARHLWGAGFVYFFIQASTAGVLFLAANTAFAAYPRLCAILAEDQWLPGQLAVVGDRLVFSNGIIMLAAIAIFLVITFQGDTHSLVSLYAVGVFTAFTLNQAGMVKYWLRVSKASVSSHLKSKQTYIKALISGFGALMTAGALVITIEAKFMEGAFLVVIATPVCLLIFYAIRSHYKSCEQQLAVNESQLKRSRRFSERGQRAIIVPISGLHRGSLEALRFAREMSANVTALIIDINRNEVSQTCHDIEKLDWDILVVIRSSPYRSIVSPIIEYINDIDAKQGQPAVVILPEFVPAHWWQEFLHNHTALSIMKALRWDEHIPGKARIIINVPYYLTR